MRVAWILLGGALYALALPPFDSSICGWFAITPLLLAVRGHAPGAAFRYGVLYGYAIGWTVLWSLAEAAAAYLQIAVPLAVLPVALWFLVVVGIPCGCFGAASSVLLRARDSWLRPILVAVLWVTCELLRSRLLGQPWGLLGYTQHAQTDLIQVASLTGVYGVSFLMAAVGAVIADAVDARTPARAVSWLARAAVPAALVLACRIGGAAYVASESSPSDVLPTITIVQANVAPSRHWTPTYLAAQLSAHVRATDRLTPPSLPALVVWPEYAVPGDVETDPGIASMLGRTARRHGSDILFGTPRADGGRSYNSIRMVRSDGRLGEHYDKRRLVLFAERSLVGRHDDTFAEGSSPGVLEGFAPLGVSICHEILHPDLIADGVRHGARVLVNVANDSWLERSTDSAALQHLAMASFRAVETRRFLARAAITGPSAVFDPFGRVVASLPPRQSGVLTASVAPREDETWYVRIGDAFGVACMLVAATTLVGKHRRRASFGWLARRAIGGRPHP
jgi:apolipoprotein N-acyltransferase